MRTPRCAGACVCTSVGAGARLSVHPDPAGRARGAGHISDPSTPRAGPQRRGSSVLSRPGRAPRTPGRSGTGSPVLAARGESLRALSGDPESREPLQTRSPVPARAPLTCPSGPRLLDVRCPAAAGLRGAGTGRKTGGSRAGRRGGRRRRRRGLRFRGGRGCPKSQMQGGPVMGSHWSCGNCPGHREGKRYFLAASPALGLISWWH